MTTGKGREARLLPGSWLPGEEYLGSAEPALERVICG